MRCFLVLSDGTAFEGKSFGASTSSCGELVFNTSMMGYEEAITDPSYKGQLLCFSYPLLGNYGFRSKSLESDSAQASGVIAQECSAAFKHPFNDHSLHSFLKENNVPGIQGIETREIVKRIRSRGVSAGAIVNAESPEKALEYLRNNSKAIEEQDLLALVGVKEKITFKPTSLSNGKRIALLDCGVKQSIVRSLQKRGCEIMVFPSSADLEEILNYDPQGFIVSNGPGDPQNAINPIKLMKGLHTKLPTLGICLGHQILSLALGAKTFKLKFGHRGSNHPVKELKSGKVVITSQNHGYAVDLQSLKNTKLQETLINLNDDSVEGVEHSSLPVWSVQFHPEANPGPLDSQHYFDEFVKEL